MVVLDIRGTHGSGKSWIPHQLLKSNSFREIEGFCEYKKKDMVLGYHLPKYDLAIVGRYSTTCGGCDGVGQADEVCRRVRMFYDQYKFVMLEGILVAHTFQRYSDLANELGDYRFFFLNTPMDVCIERTLKRRQEVGNTKPFNPKNLKHDWHQIWENVRAKMEEAGHDVTVLRWRNPMKAILETLNE